MPLYYTGHQDFTARFYTCGKKAMSTSERQYLPMMSEAMDAPLGRSLRSKAKAMARRLRATTLVAAECRLRATTLVAAECSRSTRNRLWSEEMEDEAARERLQQRMQTNHGVGGR